MFARCGVHGNVQSPIPTGIALGNAEQARLLLRRESAVDISKSADIAR